MGGGFCGNGNEPSNIVIVHYVMSQWLGINTTEDLVRLGSHAVQTGEVTEDSEKPTASIFSVYQSTHRARRIPEHMTLR